MSVQLPLYIISKGLEAIPYQRHLTRWVSEYLGLSITRLSHVSNLDGAPRNAIKIVIEDSIELYHGEELLGVLERSEDLLPKPVSCIIISINKGTPVVLIKSPHELLRIANAPQLIGSQTITRDGTTFITSRGYTPSYDVLSVPVRYTRAFPLLSKYVTTINTIAAELMTCCVCYEEHSQLVDVCSNKHHYCDKCSRQLTHCPLCREAIA